MITNRQAANVFDRYLVSTICRGSQPGEPSGNLYIVNLEQGVQSMCPVPPPPHLPRELNPRGGIRGGRGLAVSLENELIYVANGAEVLCFDHTWKWQQTISHPWCGNVHDIAIHDGRLWVCSTANDGLAAFDPAGLLIDLIDLRTAVGMSSAGERFAASIDYRNPADYEIKVTNRLHANGIGFGVDSTPLVSLGMVEADSDNACHHGRIAYADGSGWQAMVSPNAAVPIHNVLPLSDGTVLTLDTGAGSLCSLRTDGTLATTLKLAEPAPNGFLRGMCHASDNRLLVGERNRLLIVNLNAAEISGAITLSHLHSEAVYSITRLPHASKPLPASLNPRGGS